MPQTRINPGGRTPREVNHNRYERGVSRTTLRDLTIREQDIRSKEMRTRNPNGPFSKRWDRASGYKGFSISDIDFSTIFKDNSLAVVFNVGDYKAVVELEDILYWIQLVAEERETRDGNANVTAQVVAQAFSNALDGMYIKVDCSCADFLYRFSYQATVYGYKYLGGAVQGLGEIQPDPNVDKRANAENRGAMCKHLYAILSNKNWVNQIVPRFMDWLNDNIKKVNYYLNLSGDNQLTVPGREGTELARRNALKSRGINPDEEVNTQDVDEEVPQEDEKVIRPNVQGNNPSTNRYNKISDEIESEEDNNEQ